MANDEKIHSFLPDYKIPVKFYFHEIFSIAIPIAPRIWHLAPRTSHLAPQTYSYLSALIGSMRVARRAGR